MPADPAPSRSDEAWRHVKGGAKRPARRLGRKSCQRSTAEIMLMWKKIKKLLKRITGVSTPIGGISLQPETEPKAPYVTKQEFLIIGTVADEKHVGESFQNRVGVECDADVSDLAELAKAMRAIARLQARGEESFPDSEISDPVIFDWMCTELQKGLTVSQIAHGRIVIAIFDATDPKYPPEAVAFMTQQAVQKKLDVRAFLHDSGMAV